MNRKGFTFIELLAVIVVLGLVLVIGSPSIINAFKKSKLKSEQIFVDRLSDAIDGYISLNSDNISFTKESENKTKSGKDGTYNVSIYKAQITFNDIINDELIESKDFINAGYKEATCDRNAIIEVYRDSEYVYCHKVNKVALGCLTTEYKNSISGNYVIDTCVWR